MKKTLFAILALFTSQQVFAKSPFEVSLRENQFYGSAVIIITSDENDLTIHNVVANRGKCPAKLAALHSNKLGFGEKTEYQVPNCSISTLREITVETNLGSWTFNTR